MYVCIACIPATTNSKEDLIYPRYISDGGYCLTFENVEQKPLLSVVISEI